MLEQLSKHTRRSFNGLIGAAAAVAGVPLTLAAAPEDKRTYTYKTIGGLQIQADVYNPAPEKRRPTMIWIHGGALIVGHRSGLIQRFQECLLAADWTIVSIDYRLAPETKLSDIPTMFAMPIVGFTKKDSNVSAPIPIALRSPVDRRADFSRCAPVFWQSQNHALSSPFGVMAMWPAPG